MSLIDNKNKNKGSSPVSLSIPNKSLKYSPASCDSGFSTIEKVSSNGFPHRGYPANQKIHRINPIIPKFGCG